MVQRPTVIAGVVAACLGACYEPSFEPCTVRCGRDNDCPAGLECGASGFCETYIGECSVSACSMPVSIDVGYDDFSDPAHVKSWARLWGYPTDADQTTEVVGGRLVIQLQSSTASTYSGAAGEIPFGLSGSRVLVEVVETPSAAEPAVESSFEIDGPADSGFVRFTLQDGRLHAADADVGYDRARHRWWQICEAGGTVYFETSADGRHWEAFAREATPSWSLREPAVILLYAGFYEMTLGDLGRAAFDNLNLPPG